MERGWTAGGTLPQAPRARRATRAVAGIYQAVQQNHSADWSRQGPLGDRDFASTPLPDLLASRGRGAYLAHSIQRSEDRRARPLDCFEQKRKPPSVFARRQT